MNRFNARGRKLLVTTALVLLVVILVAPMALAFEGREGDVVIIESDEVIDDDLYVGAGEFIMNGTVKGDLIVGGNTIEINGTVEGDIWAVGQTITLNGTAEDDVRIAGFALVLGGDVADDFIAGGFSLEGKSESSVSGELFYAGYQALLAGDVTKNINVAGGAVKVSGNVGGHAIIDVGSSGPGEKMPPGFPFVPNLPPVPSVPGGLTIDDSASIGGDLIYTANDRINVPSGVVDGDTEFTQYVPEEGIEITVEAPSPAARLFTWFVRQARRLITLLLIGVVMTWLAPDWTRKLASTVQTKPLPSLGWGLLVTILVIPVILILAVTFVLLAIFFGVALGQLGEFILGLGGVAVGAAWLGFRLTWTYVTKIVIGVVLGQLVFKLFKSEAAEHRWWPMLLGVLIFFVISAVPILAYLVVFVTGVFGLGAVWIWARDWLQDRKKEPVVVETETPDVTAPPIE